MKILDKYILKKFFTTYFFAVLIIVAIIVVVDYTEKVDDFINKKAPTHAIIFDYYLNLIPYWANYISPLMAFIATVFFTANLAARTEIIAILSTGVSFLRFMVPYLIGSIIIALITFYMVGWVIPNSTKVRIAFERKYVKDAYRYGGRDIHIKIAPEVYAYMESYESDSKTGYRFTLEKIVKNRLQAKLLADRITWDSTRKKWTIFDYRVRTISDDDKEKLTYGIKTDTTLNLFPKDFDSKYQLHETFTLSELNQYIDNLKTRGADGIEVFLVERYSRYASPLAVIILTCIGLIVSARKSRGGVGFQIALGFMLAFVYIMFFMMSRGIAESGNLNPMLAVWLPNIVFGSVGILLYFTIPR